MKSLKFSNWSQRLPLLMSLLLSGLLAQAQFGQQQSGGFGGGMGGGGGFGSSGFGSGGFNGFAGSGASPGLSLDSLGSDSLGGLTVKPDTRYWDPRAMFQHEEMKHRLSTNFGSRRLWEELETVNGFVQTLGQTGKPYQAFHHGFEERYYDQPFWYNPIMGRYNRYVQDLRTQVRYYDTHTPYVDVDYIQGPDNLQRVGVTLSLNPTPFLNVTGFLRRRRATGVYRSNTTDHTSLYLSSNYHLPNRRYFLFGHFRHNLLNDEMSGGSPRSGDNLPTDNGILIDPPALFNTTFFKGNSAPILDGATNRRSVQSLYVDQYYHLIGHPDSSRQISKLSLRNETSWEVQNVRFQDENINLSTLEGNIIPVYPTLAPDSTDIFENYTGQWFNLRGEASYTLEPREGFRLNVNGGLNYQRINLLKDTLLAGQNITEQVVKAKLQIPWLEANGKLVQRVSDRFPVQRTLDLGGKLYPLGYAAAYHFRDSVLSDSLNDRQLKKRQKALEKDRIPLSISVDYNLRDLNPSLFQSYFVGDSGNAYRPNPNLLNQNFNHLSAGIRYDFRTPIRAKDTLLPMHVALNGFVSRMGSMIYYGDSMQVLQAGTGEALTRVGATLDFRLRFLRKFYLESFTTAQVSTTSGNNNTLDLYAQSLPTVSSRASLYYDNRRVSFAEYFRLGVDVRLHSNFVGQTVDPISGEFFPTNYQVPAYGQVDVYALLRLRGVYVTVKYQHVNEGIFYRGYVTTPMYPMLERSFLLGVKWTFFN